MQKQAIRRIDRHGRRLRVGASAWVLAAGLLGAGPAAGVPIDTCTIANECVMFSGPMGAGLSASDATDVSMMLGIPILTAQVDVLDGIYAASVLFNPPQHLDPFPPSSGDRHVATKEWTIRNINASAGTGYLAFIRTFWDTNQVNYSGVDLGLILPNRNLDPAADPWVIIEAIKNNETFFFPAVDLGLLDVGAEADPFEVRMFIGELQEIANGTFVLPEFQVNASFTAIPEPGTALILGLGLAGLAVTGRRRS